MKAEAWIGVPVGWPRKGNQIDFEDDGTQERTLSVWGADNRDKYGFVLVQDSKGNYGSLQTFEGRVRAAEIRIPLEHQE